LYTDADNIENVHLPEDTVCEWTVIHASAENVDVLFVFIEG
jgi:hypothetical protein